MNFLSGCSITNITLRAYISHNPLKGILHLNSPANGSVQLSFTLTLCVTKRIAGGSDGWGGGGVGFILDDSLQ